MSDGKIPEKLVNSATTNARDIMKALLFNSPFSCISSHGYPYDKNNAFHMDDYYMIPRFMIYNDFYNASIFYGGIWRTRSTIVEAWTYLRRH